MGGRRQLLPADGLLRLRRCLLWRVHLKQVFVVLVTESVCGSNHCAEPRTFKTCSISASRLTLRMSSASSRVMRCCRVNWSVIDCDVAFLRPATSPPATASGVYLASIRPSQHRRVYTAKFTHF